MSYITTPTGGVTSVSAGSNMTVGGNAGAPTVNTATNLGLNKLTLSGASSFTTLSGATFSATTISATTFFSGSTNIFDIFYNPRNTGSAPQTITAGNTVRVTLSGATINIPPTGLQIGTTFNFWCYHSKTAAGTASNMFAWHLGTTGLSGDTILSSLSAVTSTAVADNGVITATCVIRGPLGASCVADTFWTLNHTNGTTGLATRQFVASGVTTTTFNSNTANLISTFSFSGGASSVTTLGPYGVETFGL